MDLSLSRNFFDLDTHFLKRRVLRASKRDLEREISTTVDRDWIFFSCEVFEVQRKPLLSSHLSIVTCCAYTKRRRSHKPLKQVCKIENTDLSL